MRLDILCTMCGSDQTEQALAVHDEYSAYCCHSCGELFEINSEYNEFILKDNFESFDIDPVLFPEI
jgi:hypothetical protein